MPTTLTATPEPAHSPPRVLIQLVYTGETTATITRTDPDGRDRPVRLAEPAALDGSGAWTGYDYESFFEAPFTYTAVVGGGGTLTSSSLSLDVPAVWLRHPGVPDLSMPIDFQGEGEPIRPVVQAVLEPLNRAFPIVVTDGRRRAKRGTITIRTADAAEEDELLNLLADTSILLLDIPPTSKTYNMDPHQYLSLGDLTENRQRADYYPWPRKIWTAPYIVVDRPAGGLQAEITWDTVLANYSTWNQVKTTFDTWNDVLTGTV